jgi:hypothetical protein
LAVIAEGVYARYLHGAMGDDVPDDALTQFSTTSAELAEKALGLLEGSS